MPVLTDRETKVLKSICSYVFGSCGPEISELADEHGMSTAEVKGVVGSLVKKGKVNTCDMDVNGREFDTFVPAFPDRGSKTPYFYSDQMSKVEFDVLVAALLDESGSAAQ
ncbi:hypothetical protein [Neptuniibacter sp. QD37_11]|uniref:hypothetical protein n=1 Tax=Neptuniibacter sp. QD37_11 TaxID=3398209 RepID=UPI0039F5C4C0